MIELILAGAGATAGFVTVKRFVRERLRFVDRVHRKGVPVVAGVAAGLVAMPLAALPLIGPLSAILFGVGVGTGVAAGRRALKRLPSP